MREYLGTLHTTATQGDPTAGTEIVARFDSSGRVWAKWLSDPNRLPFKLRSFHIVHWHGARDAEDA